MYVPAGALIQVAADQYEHRVPIAPMPIDGYRVRGLDRDGGRIEYPLVRNLRDGSDIDSSKFLDRLLTNAGTGENQLQRFIGLIEEPAYQQAAIVELHLVCIHHGGLLGEKCFGSPVP